MPKSPNYLLIGSIQAYSGKSATVLGIAHQLQTQGLKIAYGKPLGTCFTDDPINPIEADVQFMSETLQLPGAQLRSTLVSLQAPILEKRLRGEDQTDYRQSLLAYNQHTEADLVLLEGPSTLDDGLLLNLSLGEIAHCIDASILLVVRLSSSLSIDPLLAAKQRLGERLMGIVINDLPQEQLEMMTSVTRPFLEAQGIPVLAVIPRSPLLRSVNVGELVKRLNAEVLCRPDRLNLMVESLCIGAMNVSSAVKYFRKANNMAVVTGGDRTDIQMAALEASTQCLILTGQLPASPLVVSRAEEVEVPVLSVDLDTLTTVEIIDQTFGQVRLHEPGKVECMVQLMNEHFDQSRFMSQLQLKPTVAV